MKTELVPIRKLVEPVTSWNPLREDDGTVFDYIDLSAIDNETKVITSMREVLCAEAPSRARQLAQQGDILVSTVRPNLNGVARVPVEMDGATASTGFCVLRATRGKLDEGFLFHWVKSPAFIRDMVSKATGANYPAVSDRIILDSLIPLPSLSEQRRIAAILDAADALRAKRRRALARLDDLARSLFLHHFGDPVSNPKGWPTGTLGDLLSLIRNGVNAEQRTEPGGWPISRIETIADGTINPARVRWITPDDSLTDDFQLRDGDILFSHINSVEHIAKTAIYMGAPPLLIHGINLLRLRPNPDLADSVWLVNLLKQDALRTYFRSRCKKAVNQASLNQPDIKSAPAYIPPLALQQRFARELAAVEAQKARQRAHLAKLDTLFTSLQSRAFTGGL